MTTWNVLTVTNTTGAPIHLGMMLSALQEHAGYDEVDGGYDGQELDVESHWNPEQQRMVPVPNAVQASFHTKYSADLDIEAVSKFLGPDFTVSHLEEWDDEEPGRTDTVFVNGEVDQRASSSLVDVSNLIAGERDALTDPRILTFQEVVGGACDQGVHFLLLPPAKS